MQAALARRGLHGSERKMLHSARRKFLALALSLLAAASVLAVPASAATRLVKNTATVSHGAAGIGPVNSNEVTLEVGSATIGGVRGGGAATLTLYGDQATTRPIRYLLLGTTGYLKLDARACKNDPASLQTRIATLTTSDGDSEQVLATETAPDSQRSRRFGSDDQRRQIAEGRPRPADLDPADEHVDRPRSRHHQCAGYPREIVRPAR